MNEIETNSYDYLRRKRYAVHEEHEQFIRPNKVCGRCSSEGDRKDSCWINAFFQ